MSEWVEGFDRFKATAEEFIDANDSQVVVRVHQQAVGAESRAPVESTFWFVFTLSDQRLVRLDMYPRKDQALEATGLAG